jgi:hypothetical protein
VPAGTYVLTATKDGFSTLLLEDVQLAVGQHRTVTLTLALGGVASEVRVTANVVALDRREGTAANPHDHVLVATVTAESDETDGLDLSSAPLPGFSNGLLVMMNSGARNCLIHDWSAIVQAATAPSLP